MLGNLGLIWEAKATVGGGELTVEHWGWKLEQLGYSYKDDSGVTRAYSTAIIHSLVIHLESSSPMLSGLLPLLFQVISSASSFLN